MSNYNKETASLYELEKYIDTVNSRIESLTSIKKKNEENLGYLKKELDKIDNYNSEMYDILSCASAFVPLVASLLLQPNAGIGTHILIGMSGLPLYFVTRGILLYAKNVKDEKKLDLGDGKKYSDKIKECEEELIKCRDLKFMLLAYREKLKDELDTDKVKKKPIYYSSYKEAKLKEKEEIPEAVLEKILKK